MENDVQLQDKLVHHRQGQRLKEAPKFKGTQAVQVQELLAALPWLSATSIANILGQRPSSISSLLYRLVQQNVLVRQPNKGPSGGWGYALRVTPIPKSLWTDTKLGKRCLSQRFARESGRYLMLYEDGSRGWASGDDFGTGKRFRWSRTDFLLDVIEGPDPV